MKQNGKVVFCLSLTSKCVALWPFLGADRSEGKNSYWTRRLREESKKIKHFSKNKAALEDESNTECIYLATSTCTLIPSMP
jgi:hypothetical protein